MLWMVPGIGVKRLRLVSFERFFGGLVVTDGG